MFRVYLGNTGFSYKYTVLGLLRALFKGHIGYRDILEGYYCNGRSEYYEF